ncbi:hypothetical protein BV372_03170 [Nostoc sp. T09]|nr:hypothetical protein BV372_03170 [Nostoc sp. T09]
MSQIQLAVVISYLLISCYFFGSWFVFSLRHPTSSPEDKLLSFVMFLITTVFWPLMIPISCLEMLKQRKMELSTVIPLLLAMFAFSISYYLGDRY